ncbi:MAG TPA: alpha/beta hydrolase [Gemmataceae bacterium]|nr:alpha/beta hydrolase [Gemmataceae bacterium]
MAAACRFVLLALAATAALPVSAADPPVAPAPRPAAAQPPPQLLPLQSERDITYATIDGQKLQLDITRPKDGGPYPCIVCLHGGAWKLGSRRDVSSFADAVAARGYVVAAVSYRLAPKYKFPAQIEDARTAVRFLRANAKTYNLDPTRIGAVGFSAGAHLALLLGVADKAAELNGTLYLEQDGRVQCVVSFFGPTDLSLYAASPGLVDAYMVPLLGKEVKTDPKLYKRASPIEYVTKDAPPILMIHGTFDLVVPIIHSERMLEKLRDVGVTAELIKVPGEGHGWSGPTMARTTEDAVKFLDAHLKGKK